MKEEKLKTKAIKIILLGDDLVGKTSIINSLLSIGFTEDTIATIGIEKSETEFPLNNGNNIKLILWDTAGQERFREIELKYIKGIHGVVLVFSVINYNSFKNLDLWLKQISEYTNNNMPIVLFGNKIDLPKENWEVTNEQGKEFAKLHNLAYFETSAKTKHGVNEGFSYIVNECYKRLEEKNQNIIDEEEKQNIKIEEKISGKDNCVGKKKKNKKNDK